MKTLYLPVAVIFTMFFLADNSLAQCVQCKPSPTNPNALSCQSSSSGGKECGGGGDACTIAGVCKGLGDLPPGDETNNLYSKDAGCSNEKIGRIEIDSNVIRAIGEQHPRFAIALGYVRRNGLLGSNNVEVTLLPIKINQEIYSIWLERALAQPIFGKNSSELLFRDGKKLPKPSPDAELVTYLVEIVSSNGGTGKMLRLQVIKGFPDDPNFTTLELPLTETANPDSLAGSEKSWKVFSWEIK